MGVQPNTVIQVEKCITVAAFDFKYVAAPAFTSPPRGSLSSITLAHNFLWGMESSAKQVEIKIQEVLRKAQGPATILAIGTANPANFILQEDYPEFYFRVTKSDNMTLLKEKFKRICE